MISASVTLNPTTYGGANADKVYDLLGYSSLSESTRRVSATVTSTPETLVVKHRNLKIKDCDTAQHLVRLDTLLTDPVKGQCQLGARLVIEVPNGTTVVTDQMVKDMAGRLIAFYLASGNHARLMNSEA